jgi:hypothetical protein
MMIEKLSVVAFSFKHTQYLEQHTTRQAMQENYENAIRPENRPKNRYTNILPRKLFLIEMEGEDSK